VFFPSEGFWVDSEVLRTTFGRDAIQKENAI